MDGGIIVLIIIGIVLNMVIKGMRGRMQQPTPKQPAPRPDQGMDRPFTEEPRPQAPPRIQPQPAPRVMTPAPVSDREGTAGMEGVSMRAPHLGEQPGYTVTGVKPLAETERIRAASPVTEWFRGDGIVRGIIMSEILNPPVSRRR